MHGGAGSKRFNYGKDDRVLVRIALRASVLALARRALARGSSKVRGPTGRTLRALLGALVERGIWCAAQHREGPESQPEKFTDAIADESGLSVVKRDRRYSDVRQTTRRYVEGRGYVDEETLD